MKEIPVCQLMDAPGGYRRSNADKDMFPVITFDLKDFLNHSGFIEVDQYCFIGPAQLSDVQIAALKTGVAFSCQNHPA